MVPRKSGVKFCAAQDAVQDGVGGGRGTSGQEKEIAQQEIPAGDVWRVIRGGWVGGRQRHLCGALTHDLHERLLGAGLLEVGALLLLDHAHRVDERGREDRRGGRRGEAWLAALVAGDDAVAQQDAKLRYALEQHADQAGPQAGERGR